MVLMKKILRGQVSRINCYGKSRHFSHPWVLSRSKAKWPRTDYTVYASPMKPFVFLLKKHIRKPEIPQVTTFQTEEGS